MSVMILPLHVYTCMMSVMILPLHVYTCMGETYDPAWFAFYNYIE